ncbi:MAG: 30S ribosomal protein S11 [bacterium]
MSEPITATTEAAQAAKAVAPARRKKKAVVKSVSVGKIYVHATFNNTIVTLTDTSGNVVGWSSAGKIGFKGPKKATPYAASLIVKDLMDRLGATGIKEVSVFLKGIGAGRDAAVRALNANGLNVTSIKDVTPLPHNGCRRPRVRRI